MKLERHRQPTMRLTVFQQRNQQLSQPQKGSALLFFPSLGGIPSCPIDVRLAHCGEEVSSSSKEDKWIAQLWLCERSYRPSAPEGNCKLRGEAAMVEWCDRNGDNEGMSHP